MNDYQIVAVLLTDYDECYAPRERRLGTTPREISAES